MLRLVNRVCAAALGCALAGSAARATVIVDYNLTGLPGSGTPPASANATTVALGATAQTLTRGAGIDPAALANGFSSNNWTITAGTDQTAIANAEYYQFGFTVPGDAPASLSEFDTNLRRSAIDAPKHFALYSSFDGFATAGTLDVSFNYLGRSSGTAGSPAQYSWMTTDTPGQDAGNPIQPQDLTTVYPLQNIPAGTTVTFRLYGWGDGGGAAASNTVAVGRVQGPKLLGEVPEPSSLAMLAGGIALTALRRRRAV
jgi:hypothetical protein